MKLKINFKERQEVFNSKLLYCLTCQQIKSQKSLSYEICSYYCPHCLVYSFFLNKRNIYINQNKKKGKSWFF